MVYSYFLDYLNSLTNYQFYFFFFEFLFILFIIYLVITDDRFLLNRKIIFILIILFLIIFSFYIDKTPYLIIKDLFWYSLILNVSFIFHVLILDRIFHWCWKNHYEYLGFIVSRISFTLSISVCIYFINIIRDNINNIFSTYSHWVIIKEYEKNMQNKNKYLYKYALFIENIRKNNKIIYKIFHCIHVLLVKPLIIIKIILLHFSKVFHNYSLLLLGKNSNPITFDIILKYIIIFLIFFTIAYLIGIPRLYVIWIFQGIVEIYNIFNNEYEHINAKIDFQKLNLLGKLQDTIKNYSKIRYLGNCSRYKYKELEEIYEKPYHTFFMFDLYKFLGNKYSDGLYWGIWGAEDTIYEDYNENLKYPILKIYKFYPWEEMAIGYIQAEIAVYKIDGYDEIVKPKWEILTESLEWCDLINRDQKLLLKIMPDTIKEEDLPINKNFIKNLKKKDYNINYD